MVKRIRVSTPGRGLHEITDRVLRATAGRSLRSGLCTVFIRHTSASLLIQENADPSARRDLEAWLDRHVPDGDPHFTHTAEGPDDMPAHVRAAITATSLSIPIWGGKLGLGAWQGIYLWEHRLAGHTREILVHTQGHGATD